MPLSDNDASNINEFDSHNGELEPNTSEPDVATTGAMASIEAIMKVCETILYASLYEIALMLFRR